MNLVVHLREEARRRLAVLANGATVADAARILASPVTPLVLISDPQAVVVGVISRMDVVKLFARVEGDAARTPVTGIMTREFVSCREDQTLQSVWDVLSARGLRCAPVLEAAGRAQGLLHARDLVRALLDEVTTEESLLRDYVLGVGYR